MLIYSLEEVGHASFSAEHHIVNVKSSPKPSLSKSALCSSRWTLPAEKWRYRSEKRICFSKRSLGWDVGMQPKVCVTDKILPHWLLGEKVIVEVGQKLSLYDNHFACPLGYPFPEDSLSELICCFARRVAQLEYSCKENSQQPPQGSGSISAAQVGVTLQSALAGPDKANASMPNCFTPAYPSFRVNS